MVVVPILAVSFVMKMVSVLFILSALILILLILIQKGKGGGLGAAFAGGAASGLLGSKTGDFLTWVTIAMVAMFLILAIIMGKFYKPTIENIAPEAPASSSMPIQGADQTGTTPSN